MKKQHVDSTIFTVVSLIGSFIIILISIGKQYISSHAIDLAEIVKKGDIYIICASMAITAIYNFYTFKSEIKNGWPGTLFWISLLNYTACLIIFLLIPVSSIGIEPFWYTSSITVFVVNIVTTYFAAFYQNINTDVIADRSKQTDDLEGKFKKELGGQ